MRNLNFFFEALIGHRQVKIIERHTVHDFAHNMKWLVDELHPQAKIIRVILPVPGTGG